MAWFLVVTQEFCEMLCFVFLWLLHKVCMNTRVRVTTPRQKGLWAKVMSQYGVSHGVCQIVVPLTHQILCISGSVRVVAVCGLQVVS